MNDPLLRAAEWLTMYKSSYLDTSDSVETVDNIIKALETDPDLRDYVFDE